MNPYAPKTTREYAKKTPATSNALFAREVYDEEALEVLEARDAKKKNDESLSSEIAQLRAELRGEARTLRSALARPAKIPAELLAEIATLRAAVAELLASPPPAGKTSGSKRDDAAALIQSRGIEGPAAAALTRLSKTSTKKSDLSEPAVSVATRLHTATRMIVKTAPFPGTNAKNGQQTIIALVGPAGVGKTTTAAKLAAHARMSGKSVALVSCDSFRVGAMDQLAKYADLMGAAFHTATTQIELMDILFSERADVIIVDTSGRAVDPEATEAFLASTDLREPKRDPKHLEILLCIPAALRASDAARVHRDFAIVKPTGVIITKVDETELPAGIVHATFATKLPICAICTGQRVPEDISNANETELASILFPTTLSTDNAQ